MEALWCAMNASIVWTSWATLSNEPRLMARWLMRPNQRSTWINDGTADRFIQWHRREAAARQRVAREVLGDFDGPCHPASYHLWLRLPHQWESNLFVAQGLVNGVSVSPGSAFAIAPDRRARRRSE